MEWVRRLARSLVRDAHEADDLVQSTWVVALERPPQVEKGKGGLRGWLATVMRNLARQGRRSDGRRTWRERARAKHERLPAASDIVERGAMQRQVADAVMSLEEPYRSTILYRYLDDCNVRQIAAQQRVSQDAVRKRLSRGMEMLQGRLDSAFGDRSTWTAGIGALASVSGVSRLDFLGAWIVSTKSIVGGVAVAAAAVLVATLWMDGGSGSEVDGAVEVRSVTPDDLTSGPDPATEVEGVEAVWSREESRGLPENSGSSFRLMMVEAATGRAVPGAEVWYGPTSLVSRASFGPPDTESLKDQGRRVAADPNGDALLPKPDGYCAAIAQADGLYGFLYFSEETEWPRRMELFPDSSVTIQAVSDAGEPMAGVPVGLRVGGEHGEEADWKTRTEGDNGLVTFKHFGFEYREELAKGWVPYATLPFPLADPVEVEFSSDPDPGEVIRLVVPPTGSVTIELLDQLERAVENTWVHLTPLLEDELWAGRSRRGDRYSLFTGSPAVFTHVGLGLTLKAALSVPHGSTFVDPELIASGPRSPGEKVSLVLRYEQQLPVLVGRLLSEDRTPIARARGSFRFRYSFADGRQEEDTESLRTDDEGHFRVRVRSQPEAAIACEVYVQASATDESPALAADVDTPFPLLRGEVLLGDLVLRSLPLIASGVVVDTAGEPVYWATIDLAKKRYYQEPRFVWDWVPEVRVQTDEDGRFEMRGNLDSGEYGLNVMGLDYIYTGIQELAPGTKDLRLVLTREGSLVGSVVLPDRVPASWFRVEVRSEGRDPDYDPAKPMQGRSSSVVEALGGFLVEDLWPGLAEVQLRLPWEPEPLLRVENVLIEEGGITRDPRLVDLDLSDWLQLLEITALDASDKPIPFGYVAFYPAGRPEDGVRRVTLSDGRALIAKHWPAVDLEVVGLGYRTVRLEGVGKDRSVLMRKGIPVHLELDEGVELPEAEQLRVGLLPADHRDYWSDEIHSKDGAETIPWGSWVGSTYPAFDSSRRVTIELPDPGEYEIRWHLEQTLPDGRRIVRSLRSTLGEIVVEDSSDPVSFVVAPEAESYSKALEASRHE